MSSKIQIPSILYKLVGLKAPLSSTSNATSTISVTGETIHKKGTISGNIDTRHTQIYTSEELEGMDSLENPEDFDGADYQVIETPLNTKRLENLMNIDDAFKKTRLIALSAMAFALLFSITVMLVAMQMVTKGKGIIYVTNGFGETTLAKQIDANQNKSAEVKAQVRNFHTVLYNITPNPKTIKENIETTLLMGDGSVKALLDKRGDSYYKKLIASEVEVKYEHDSIQVNVNVYPYKAVQFGKEVIQSNVGFVVKNLITSCELKDVARTDINPHGLLISNFNVIKNERQEFIEFKKK